MVHFAFIKEDENLMFFQELFASTHFFLLFLQQIN